jgi:hypothetical protein
MMAAVASDVAAAPGEAAQAAATLRDARRALSDAEESRAIAAATLRRSLDSSRRSLRSLLSTFDAVAASVEAGDLTRQRMRHQLALAVASLDRALDRLCRVVELNETLPGELGDAARRLEASLTPTRSTQRRVALALGFAESTGCGMSELDRSLDACRKGVRLLDGGIRACQVAVQDLANSWLLPSTFWLARFVQTESRLSAAASGAREAARNAEAAAARADAAEARRWVFTLDVLGEDAPPPQRPAFYSLIGKRFGVPDPEVSALAAASLPLGRTAASLLLGMAARTPEPPPARPKETTPSASTVTTREALRPVSLEEGIRRGMPLLPLNLCLRLLALDVGREIGMATPR